MQDMPFMLWERLQSEPGWSPYAGQREKPVFGFGNSALSSLVPGEYDEDHTAMRWRRTMLRLSDHFTSTATAHPELASVLLEALGNSLEQLLLFGRQRDLEMLEEWLDEELR